MFKFENSLITKRRKYLKMTFRALHSKTVFIDPEGKGVSVMTCQRIESGIEPSIKHLILVCEALGISPRSTFVRGKANTELGERP